MSEEFLQKVFNPFMQEKQDARTTYGGTGLGLSIVKKVVEHMGGTIEILSKQNIGTTVTIVIPFELDKNPPVSMEEEPIAELTNLEGVKILMVEDNFLNREIANYMLKEVGAIVTNVENGLEAVELFEEQPADTFDLILMDIMMPVMDGLEATRQIRKLKREDARTIPIIALTANAFASDIQDCKDAGMNAHIAKPLIMENLFDALKGLKR
jgi:CheY-like chemotaxis protein